MIARIDRATDLAYRTPLINQGCVQLVLVLAILEGTGCALVLTGTPALGLLTLTARPCRPSRPMGYGNLIVHMLVVSCTPCDTVIMRGDSTQASLQSGTIILPCQREDDSGILQEDPPAMIRFQTDHIGTRAPPELVRASCRVAGIIKRRESATNNTG